MMEKKKKKKEVGQLGFSYLSLMGSFCFILEFLLDSWKDNFVILVVESLIPYHRPILLDFWRDNITNLVIKFDFSYLDQFYLI